MSDDNKLVPSENELKELEKQLKAVNPKVFDGLKREQKQAILSSVNVSVSTYRSGPLPVPYELEHYNEIINNGAERIMVMAEKEQDHRHEIEKRLNSNQYKDCCQRTMDCIISCNRRLYTRWLVNN